MLSRRLACIALGLCVSASLALAADASLIDDFNQLPYQWRASKSVELSQLTLQPADPLALPGQTTPEGVLKVDGPRHVDVKWPNGQFCHKGRHFDRDRVIERAALQARQIAVAQVVDVAAAEVTHPVEVPIAIDIFEMRTRAAAVFVVLAVVYFIGVADRE